MWLNISIDGTIFLAVSFREFSCRSANGRFVIVSEGQNLCRHMVISSDNIRWHCLRSQKGENESRLLGLEWRSNCVRGCFWLHCRDILRKGLESWYRYQFRCFYHAIVCVDMINIWGFNMIFLFASCFSKVHFCVKHGFCCSEHR